MERSFIVASFIILITLTTVNNLAEPDFKLFFDSDEIDLDIYSSEDSFLTISDDVKDLIASSESEMDYDQSSVNPSKKIQFRQGIMNIMQQSGGGSQSVGIAGFGFGFPFTGSGGGFPFTGSGGGSPNTGYEPKCPFGFSLVNNLCYHLSTATALWEEALWKCRAMDAELASAATETEWKNVKTFISANDPKLPVWISLNDLDQEGSYVWRGRNTKLSYNQWCPGEPNNRKTDEDCVEFYFVPQINNFCWNDEGCSLAARYMCEKRAV